MMKKFLKILQYLLLLLCLLVSVFPFIWMGIGATNSSDAMFMNPPKFTIGNQAFENYQNLNESINVPRVIFNSLVVSLITLILALVVCTMAAYALSKFKFKGGTIILGLLLVSQMIPQQTKIIPLFQMIANANLLNSYFALIAPSLAYPLGVFLLKQNFEAVPDEILESARLDGASELYIFLKIVLPNMKSALAATSILLFMNTWNSFLWPLVATNSSDMYTFPVALSSLTGVSFTDYGQIMMGLSIATVPVIIFFLLLQKHFISGMLGSAVK